MGVAWRLILDLLTYSPAHGPFPSTPPSPAVPPDPPPVPRAQAAARSAGGRASRRSPARCPRASRTPASRCCCGASTAPRSSAATGWTCSSTAATPSAPCGSPARPPRRRSSSSPTSSRTTRQAGSSWPSLRTAAERGLTVRVLADALGSSSTRAEFWQEMESHGIEVHLFHPMFKGFWYQPFRDHRKILVLDRKVAFTGGMNIGEEYGSIRRRPKPGETWRDTHVRVTGPAAWQMAVVFSEGWVHSDGEMFEIDPLPSLRSGPARVADHGARLAAQPGPGRVGGGAGRHQLGGEEDPVDHQRLLRSRPPRDRPPRATPRRGASTCASSCPARPTCPSSAGRATAITDSSSNGECESSSTRPPSSTPRPWWRTAYVSVVGSTNLDFRSFVFNNECDLLMLCPITAATLEKAFLNDLNDAEEIKREDWAAAPCSRRSATAWRGGCRRFYKPSPGIGCAERAPNPWDPFRVS